MHRSTDITRPEQVISPLTEGGSGELRTLATLFATEGTKKDPYTCTGLFSFVRRDCARHSPHEGDDRQRLGHA